jgi:hypothetical protein
MCKEILPFSNDFFREEGGMLDYLRFRKANRVSHVLKGLSGEI